MVRLTVRLSFANWSRAVDAGKWPEIRAWLRQVEAALAK